MATVIVYNNYNSALERYERDWSEPMPYSMGRTLTVGEFRGVSCSQILWTELRLLEAWNETRAAFGRALPVRFAFRRIWEGGHAPQSQHYAGLSLDMGQGLPQRDRNALYALARRLGVWSYVEPLNLTPTWVHTDTRHNPPACPRGGYPLLRQGSRGPYVFTLQDALSALGYSAGGLDGAFGQGVRDGLSRFQRDRGLSPDGVAGCETWTALASAAVGSGQTPTVIGGCR